MKHQVILPSLRITKSELLDRAAYLADYAAKTTDPVLKRARFEAAEALQVEAVKLWPSGSIRAALALVQEERVL
jgi:hypothetical protein